MELNNASNDPRQDPHQQVPLGGGHVAIGDGAVIVKYELRGHLLLQVRARHPLRGRHLGPTFPHLHPTRNLAWAEGEESTDLLEQDPPIQQ
jgi:hypothetical protein